jgi:hypothetical protein
MYSMTFALIVIIGMAGMNLFLGFAAAVLMGRGPKSWSDVDRALVFRSFSLELLGIRRKSAVETSDQTTPVEQPVTDAQPHPTPAVTPPVSASTETDASQTTEAPAEEPILTLEPLAPKNPVDETPPEQKLDDQLLEWREDEETDDIASISMLVLAAPSDETEPEATPLLREAIHDTMRKQIRRDRVLMTLEEGQYVWFSSDVHPEDALMPVERIRQTLQKMHFEYYERNLEITIHSAVAAARREDRAKDLTKRLREAIAAAEQSGEDVVFLDLGSGPESTECLEIEVSESTCVLSS